MEPKIKGLGLNTILTAFATILMLILGFLGTKIWNDVSQTHDAVLIINATMVRQSELQDVKAHIITLEQKQTELQHLQDQMSLEIRRINQRAAIQKGP